MVPSAAAERQEGTIGRSIAYNELLIRDLLSPGLLLYGESVDAKMNWQDRISVDPKVLVGKPVVRGTRIAVELVIDLMAKGWTQEQILDSYPNLTPEDIRACLAYASDVLHLERVYPVTST